MVEAELKLKISMDAENKEDHSVLKMDVTPEGIEESFVKFVQLMQEHNEFHGRDAVQYGHFIDANVKFIVEPFLAYVKYLIAKQEEDQKPIAIVTLLNIINDFWGRGFLEIDDIINELINYRDFIRSVETSDEPVS